MGSGAVVIIGGTSGIGRELAVEYARRGNDVVLSGREFARAESVAAGIDGSVKAIAVDLAEPDSIEEALAGIGPVSRLAIPAVERDVNHIHSYDRVRAQRLVTLKLIGYPTAVATLRERFDPDASVVLFGGLAKERPYDGSTTVTSVNGGISALTRTLACELAPIRVNAIHPGIVGDSEYWIGKPLEAVIARTPLGRLVTIREVVEATVFLLECEGMNATDLVIDGGWLVR